MKGGAIPFVDDDSDDAGLMYDDIGGIAPAPLEKAPIKTTEPTNSALPDLTPSPQKKKKSGKDVLGVTTKKVRPKFTENDLAKDNGLEWLPKHAPKRAKFQGRDVTDARRLVDTYRAWAKQLFPSVPLDELLQRTDKFGHKMFVRGLVENLRDLQRREVRLAKRRARGEIVDEVEEEKNPIEDKKAAALALKAKKQAEREAQREMEELMRQREDIIDEEGEALMDLMDAEEGHGPMPVARPPPVPEDDLDAAMAAFDEAAAAAPSEPAPAEPMATEPAAAAPAAAEPSPAPAAAMDADETPAVPPTQDVAPTQIVPPTRDRGVRADAARPAVPGLRPARRVGARVQLAAVPGRIPGRGGGRVPVPPLSSPLNLRRVREPRRPVLDQDGPQALLHVHRRGLPARTSAPRRAPGRRPRDS